MTGASINNGRSDAMEQGNGSRLRVALLCTGVDHYRGGIETFFWECFEGLREHPALDLVLCKGTGAAGPREHLLPCLKRNDRLTRLLGRLVHRSSYTVEQLTAFPWFARFIRRWRPHVIFYSDGNHGFQLYRWRRRIGVDFKLLLSNGGPVHPPFVRTDFVQQVAPYYLEEALAAGEPPEKHFMVPYGVNVPPGDTWLPREGQLALRKTLGLPTDRTVLISVGWLSATHKRMDYVIDEVASIQRDRPFLAMVGRMDESTPAIVARAREKLGPDGFVAVSVPYDKVAQYYQAADLFALGSLTEGFGRVFLEALIHGLPCLVNDFPVMRYVIGEDGQYGDFSRPGGLAGLLAPAVRRPTLEEDRRRRKKRIEDRFGWPVLADQYAAMFQQCLARSQPMHENRS